VDIRFTCTVIADSTPLTHLTTSTPKSAKLTRWTLARQEFTLFSSIRRNVIVLCLITWLYTYLAQLERSHIFRYVLFCMCTVQWLWLRVFLVLLATYKTRLERRRRVTSSTREHQQLYADYSTTIQRGIARTHELFRFPGRWVSVTERHTHMDAGTIWG
jgi:hypothetical protein